MLEAARAEIATNSWTKREQGSRERAWQGVLLTQCSLERRWADSLHSGEWSVRKGAQAAQEAPNREVLSKSPEGRKSRPQDQRTSGRIPGREGSQGWMREKRDKHPHQRLKGWGLGISRHFAFKLDWGCFRPGLQQLPIFGLD